MNTQTFEDYSLVSAEHFANPYPYYEHLRATDPIHWSTEAKRWLIINYADVITLFKHPHSSSARLSAGMRRLSEVEQQEFTPVISLATKQVLYLDPPDHARVRGLIMRAFTPRIVESFRATVQQIVEDLLDNLAAKGQFDVMTDIAYQLPVIMIAQLLGIPTEERDQFRVWSEEFFKLIANSGWLTADIARQSQDNALALVSYFTPIIEERRKHPKDDLISLLVQAKEQDNKLSDEEIVANAVLMLSAGHETTQNLITNGIFTLLEHPDQLAKLRQHPELIGTAVEEIFRFSAPVQWMGRVVNADIELGDKTLKAGQALLLGLAAANRDPKQFERPAEFDITRTDNRHLDLGHGIHFCIGASLARLEAQLAINSIVQRFPNLQLVNSQPKWDTAMMMRGLKTLPLTF